MKRIKVAHVITRLIQGGAQRVCLDLVEGLDDERYEVTLLTGLETGSEGHFFEEVARHKIRLIKIPSLVRKISLLHDGTAFFHLWFLFFTKRFTIIHLHTSKAGVLGVLAARLAGVCVVIYSSHGHIFDRRARLRDLDQKMLGPLLWLRRWMAALSDKVIALTLQDEKEQVELGIAGYAKFQVIHNGVNLKAFSRDAVGDPAEIRRELEIDYRHYPILVCVSRLSPEKGLSYLLEAAVLLASSFPSLKLLLVGDGPEREGLLKRTRELGAESLVRFLGRRDDVARVLSISDIFILPSLYEAMGIVLAEAMAMQVPVLATRVGGVAGIVDHGANGILVEPAKAEAIAEAVRLLMKDELVRKKMGANGLRRAQEFFSLDQMIRKTEGLYEKLLRENGIRMPS